jgi:cytidine deaminase
MIDNKDILMEKARNVSKNAYAPYSNYHVGSALVTEKGNYFVGANVENSSYGATICAERGAILSAVANEGDSMRISSMAIYTSSSPPAGPCGLCLQVFVEFAHDDTEIILLNNKNEVTVKKLGDLLPNAFRRHILEGE